MNPASGMTVLSKAVNSITDSEKFSKFKKITKLQNRKTVNQRHVVSEDPDFLCDKNYDTFRPSTDREKCSYNSSLPAGRPLDLPDIQSSGRVNDSSTLVTAPLASGINTLFPEVLLGSNMHNTLSKGELNTSVVTNVCSNASLAPPALPDNCDPSQSEEKIGEDTILLVASNGSNVQLVLNSVLCYTKKGLESFIKVKQLTDILINIFDEDQLNNSWNLARSLLKKKDRPLRGQSNYISHSTQKSIVIGKQIVKMCKQISCDKSIILASSDLSFPVLFEKADSSLEQKNVSVVNKVTNDASVNCDICKCIEVVKYVPVSDDDKDVAFSLLPDNDKLFLPHDAIEFLCSDLINNVQSCQSEGSVVELVTADSSIEDNTSETLHIVPNDHLISQRHLSLGTQTSSINNIATVATDGVTTLPSTVGQDILTELKVISNLLLTAVKGKPVGSYSKDSSLNWTNLAQEWLTPCKAPEKKVNELQNLPSHSTPNTSKTNRSYWLHKSLQKTGKNEDPANLSIGNPAKDTNCSHLKSKCTSKCSDLNIVKTLFEVNPLHPDTTYTVVSKPSTNAIVATTTTGGKVGELIDNPALPSINPLHPTSMALPPTNAAPVSDMAKSTIGNIVPLHSNQAYSLPFCLPFSYATPTIPTVSAPTSKLVTTEIAIDKSLNKLALPNTTVAPPPGFKPLTSLFPQPPAPVVDLLDSNNAAKLSGGETKVTSSVEDPMCSPNSFWNLKNQNVGNLATQSKNCENPTDLPSQTNITNTPNNIPLDQVLKEVPKSRVNLKSTKKSKPDTDLAIDSTLLKVLATDNVDKPQDKPLNLVKQCVAESNDTNENLNSKLETLISKAKENSDKYKQSKNKSKLRKKSESNKNGKRKSDETYNSHVNNKVETKNQVNLVESEPSSESESEVENMEVTDGPIVLAPSPSEKYLKPQEAKNLYQPPSRNWGPIIDNDYQNYQGNQNSNQGFNNNNICPPTYINHPSQHRDFSQEGNNINQKPNCIKENTYRCTVENANGEEVYEEKSVLHDDFEVYHSTAYKKKMKRIEKLKNERENKGLIPAKRQIGTRFALTNVRVDLIDQDIERYLLENFDSLYNVYVRKCPLKSDKYASFIFIVYADEEVDPEPFQNHNWPGRVRCFFAPLSKRGRY